MRANDPKLVYLRRIAGALGDLCDQLVFVGAFSRLLANRDFENVLPGMLAEPERANLVLERLGRLCQ